MGTAYQHIFHAAGLKHVASMPVLEVHTWYWHLCEVFFLKKAPILGLAFKAAMPSQRAVNVH